MPALIPFDGHRHRQPRPPSFITILSFLTPLLLYTPSTASFLSSWTATDYTRGDRLAVLAHSLFNDHRLPYDYFSLPFCTPTEPSIAHARATNADDLSLGQILLGDRARLTAYDLRMLQPVSCAALCTSTFDAPALRFLSKLIRGGYRASLTLDDMPAVVRSADGAQYKLGFPLGYAMLSRNGRAKLKKIKAGANLAEMSVDTASADGLKELFGLSRAEFDKLRGPKAGIFHALRDDIQTFAYNHLDITIMYHVPDDLESVAGRGALSDANQFRVVGFEVQPRSVQFPLRGKSAKPETQCISSRASEGVAAEAIEIFPADHYKDGDSESINFTYSLRFVESKVAWVTRFDTLIRVSRRRSTMQWFAVVNSLMVAVFISAIFAAVLLRTLRRDCARYGFTASRGQSFLDASDNDEFENDSGWRMLRGDVFRPPRASTLLCILCGSGCQLAAVVLITIVFSAMGFVTPGRRGQLVSLLVAMYALSSGMAGYVATGMHRAIGGMHWRLVTFGVAVALPGVAFCTFLAVNILLWAMGSIGAAPFGTLFALLFLWLGVSVPLAFAGTYFGYIRKVYDFPVRTNQIPRQIPRQPRFLSSPYMLLATGAIPFGMVGIELRLILRSIVHQEIYHMFTFLFVVYVLLAVACAEVSVVVCYMRLANEDWAWFWSAWWASASSGVYVFLLSMYTLLTSTAFQPGHAVAGILFTAYAGLFSLAFMLLTGAIGCLSALAFVRRIYSISSDD